MAVSELFAIDSNGEIREELAADGSTSGVEEDVAEREYPFDADKISISAVPVPVNRLVERLKKGTISAPPIQRSNNLWTKNQQSRLIESLMLRIPLPLFYVAADNDENWKIVDGLQRVSALRNFLLDGLPLSGMEFLDDCNGLTCENLPAKYYNRIQDTTLQFAVISASTPPEVQRNIFKRLNTGGLPLTLQEIRHALYYDENVAAFLLDLVKSEEFQIATDKSINDSRMAGRELCLRFMAFLLRGTDAYPKNEDMDSFLSDTMLLLAAMPEMNKNKLKRFFGARLPEIGTPLSISSFDGIKTTFLLAMRRAHELFGTYAFRKTVDGPHRTPVNKALFETVGVTLAELDDSAFKRLLGQRNTLLFEMKNAFKGDLYTAISRDSLKPYAIKKRFSWFRKKFNCQWGESDDSQA